jgi:hypothetical protein
MEQLLNATLLEIISGEVEISIEDEQSGISDEVLDSLDCDESTVNNNLVYLLRVIGATHNRRNCYNRKYE